MADTSLKREIGLTSAVCLVIANMVGTGIFTTSGFIIQTLNEPWIMMLCWLMGGLFSLFGALCYAEIGARFPGAGGEYLFLYKSFGELPAFISGWISLVVGFSAPIAAAAIALAHYGSLLLPPHFAVWGLSCSADTGKIIAACLAILCFSFAHYYSVKLGKGIQNLLTAFKLLLILGFAAGAFLWGQGSFDHFASRVAGESDGFWAVLSDGRLAVALVFVSFAYSGWNSAAYLGGEIIRPRTNLPRALIFGTLIVICLYLLLNGVYIYAVSPSLMANAPDVGARAAIALFGSRFGHLFSAGIAMGLSSALSAMIVTGPRVYYAMARDGLFFNMFGRVSPERGTPGAAIFLQAVLAIAMVVTASFECLLIYIGFTLSLMASLTVLGMMRLRRKEGGAHDGKIYHTPAYPVIPLLFIAGNLWIVAFSLYGRPVAAVWGVGTILAGLPFYLFFKNRGLPCLSDASPVHNEK